MQRYRLHHPAATATRAEMEQAAAPYGDRIRVVDDTPGTLLVETDADTLAAFRKDNPGWRVQKSGGVTTIDPPNTLDLVSKPYVAIQEARIRIAGMEPVEPIDGQPAERYVVHDLKATYKQAAAVNNDDLKESFAKIPGIRPYTFRLCPSMIFFDAANPQPVDAARAIVPKGWTLERARKSLPKP